MKREMKSVIHEGVLVRILPDIWPDGGEFVYFYWGAHDDITFQPLPSHQDVVYFLVNLVLMLGQAVTRQNSNTASKIAQMVAIAIYYTLGSVDL